MIRGVAAVFHDDAQVTDTAVLQSLDGVVYDEERFTDYIGGPPAENEVAAALEPGGMLRFSYTDGDVLTATTEYRVRRLLSDAELRLLVEYMMGQWSDGIGENWACFSPDKCGYSLQYQTSADGIGPEYPAVEVVEE